MLQSQEMEIESQKFKKVSKNNGDGHLAYSQISLDAFFSGQILIKLEVTKNQILLKKIQH